MRVVKSADRVLDLFELLAGWGGDMSHTEIGDALEIPKSSLTQLLKNVTDRGYIEFLPSTKGYRLGAAFRRLTRQTSVARSLADIATPLLRQVTEVTQESSALNQLSRDMAKVVAAENGPQRLVLQMHLGDVAPLYATSGGKAILAFLPDAMRDEYVRDVAFEPYTGQTIRSRKELLRQIDTIRKIGVAFSFEEFQSGTVGIAVPVLDEAEHAIGSLNIALPAARHSKQLERSAIQALRKAAASIARQLPLLQDSEQPD